MDSINLKSFIAKHEKLPLRTQVLYLIAGSFWFGFFWALGRKSFELLMITIF